ncbi:Uncharacterised protein [Mycolicibacterium vanbaalenii]|uniref:Uncharacterized protein n=1 Tax=Mycolicibacterium vanbaalenii TaxID=110539 RepID=A0A5S9MQR8_MYCVN|nr:DUF427 domain-containing protein [Mycolicibacterium vanbaalenii]CAA0079442.1 Uncharacterised protein [Mycolicibacterium vanbaalenii]
MESQIEPAWPAFPDYRIDIVPSRYRGQVWLGDVLLADSDRCLVVTETDHVDRLYFPDDSVRWQHFAPSRTTSVCPFKGLASYWDCTVGESTDRDLVWTYRHPMAEVAPLAGHVCFQYGIPRTSVLETWPDGSTVASDFPLWGDSAELLRLIDVEQLSPGRFVGPAHGPTRRNVVEGGQLLAEAIVATSKSLTDQRITSASMIFTKAASFDAPVELSVEVLRRGSTFSTTEVRVVQHDSLRAVGLLLADTGASDSIRDVAPMPEVPGPEEAVPFGGFGMPGREIRVVDAAYDPEPDRVAPPVIDVWTRFRDSPHRPDLQSALLAQSATHWTIAAGMLPHRGYGEAHAHSTLSTGIMKISIAFHDDADVGDWLLYRNHAFWSGRGLVQGDGRVYTRDGRLAASYTVQAMVRGFNKDPASMGHDGRTAM